MTLKDLFRDTLQTLWSHKLRTCLTMFGIAWGIISITLMVAAGEGLRVGQERVSENFAKDVMLVFNGRTSMQAGGQRAGRPLEWRAGDFPAVKAASPSCRYVLPELERSETPLRSLYNSASLIVTGSLPPFADATAAACATGGATTGVEPPELFSLIDRKLMCLSCDTWLIWYTSEATSSSAGTRTSSSTGS